MVLIMEFSMKELLKSVGMALLMALSVLLLVNGLTAGGLIASTPGYFEFSFTFFTCLLAVHVVRIIR